MSKKWMTTGGSFAALAIVLCIVVAANVILGNVRLRKDLTEDRIYTLSDGTREFLAGLDQPVTLKFFFTHSSPQIPVFVKSYAQRVEDLLSEYRIAARGNVIVERHDPKPDSDAEDWAQRYGLSGQPLGMAGPTLYMGLVAALGDAEATIPMLDPQSENLLEYHITRMISQVATPKKPTVGVLSSLPVLGSRRPPYPMPGQPPPSPAWAAFKDLREDYDVREIGPDATDIPADLDTLVIVHPKNLGDATLYAIDQFLLRGGRLMAFLDPFCIADTESQQMPGMPFGGSRASNLEKLLAAWGVSYAPDKVVADLDAISRLRVDESGRVEESPVWLSLRERHVNETDAVTAQIRSLMLPYAGALTCQPPEGLTAAPLVSTSKDSGLVEAMTAQFGMDGVRRAFKNDMTSKPLALRLNGTFPTAFPEGKPAARPDKDENPDAPDAPKPEAVAGADAADTLKKSAKPSSVILVADVDMLHDRFAMQEVNFFGFKGHQPINDNLAFFLNALDQLAGNPVLASIRTRGRTERPFTVVQELERKAQERYYVEERRLQQRLDDAQRRLSELQSGKDTSQRLILSADQKREIEDFQKEVAKTRQELKLVRRKLREDIESLGVKLKMLNILAVPVLVCVVGVTFGVYRRRSSNG